MYDFGAFFTGFCDTITENWGFLKWITGLIIMPLICIFFGGYYLFRLKDLVRFRKFTFFHHTISDDVSYSGSKSEGTRWSIDLYGVIENEGSLIELHLERTNSIIAKFELIYDDNIIKPLTKEIPQYNIKLYEKKAFEFSIFLEHAYTKYSPHNEFHPNLPTLSNKIEVELAYQKYPNVERFRFLLFKKNNEGKYELKREKERRKSMIDKKSIRLQLKEKFSREKK